MTKLFLATLSLFFFSSTVFAADSPTCPPGSYDIGTSKTGDPICKLEPTGCPYGDSIPLDSPKCAPAQKSQQARPVAPKQPVSSQYWGPGK